MAAAAEAAIAPSDTLTTAIPDVLKSRRRWLVWRYEQSPGRKKPTKPPYIADIGEALANVTDPDDLRTFEEATAQTHRFDGIGTALGKHDSEQDRLAGADLDGCRDPATGEITPWAQEIIDVLDSYTEVSPSGTGLHVLCWGELPPDAERHRHEIGGGHVEVYDRDRYFTFTGEHLAGTPTTIEHRQSELTNLYRDIFGEQLDQATIQTPTPTSDLGDSDVLRVAFAAANGSKFAALWAGDNLDYPSPSEADAALAHLLAFYVPEPARLEGLLRQSSRVREKWDERRGPDTWLGRECARAVERVSSHYTGRPSGDLVVVDRRLLRLPDGPLLVAALLAASVCDEQEQEEALGVRTRTVREWRNQLRDAGVEHSIPKRPRGGFVLVPRWVLLNADLSVPARVLSLHLTALANAGMARVGVETLAKRRQCNRRTISRHVQELVAAEVITVDHASFVPGLGRRLRCNQYIFVDGTLPQDAPAPAAD